MKNHLLNMKFGASILLYFFISSLCGQNINDHLQAESISIFKNSTAFYIKSGNVKTVDGIYRIDEGIPGALFGTLWFNSSSGNIENVISYQDTISKTSIIKAKSYRDLLEANLNKNVKIFLHDEQTYEGTIEDVNGNLVSISTEANYVFINVSNINRLEFVNKPQRTTKVNSSKSKHVLEVDYSKNRKSQQLSMMYLQGGISWHPHYLIELNSENKARLTLNAELANNAEDIIDTDVNFVVGVPNFKYADNVATLVDFVKFTKPATNTTYQTVWSADTYEEKVVAVESTIDNSEVGSIQEDLFFYTIDKLNLKKGGRGQYKLLSTDINIEHLYECNLSGNSSANKNYTKQYLFTPNTDSKVIHTIQLDNSGSVPWTTGSALVVKNTADGAKPISQDQLNYTSVKNSSYLKLTEAPDIQVTHKEKQVLREAKFKQVPNYTSRYYDLVTVEATIKIKSYKNKKVNINVRRPLLGELIDTSVPWLKSERVREHNPLNKTTDVCWETDINSSEEKEIVYRYKLLVQGW